jgi:transposase
MEKVKDALKKGIDPQAIASVFGISVDLIICVKNRMKENGEIP